MLSGAVQGQDWQVIWNSQSCSFVKSGGCRYWACFLQRGWTCCLLSILPAPAAWPWTGACTFIRPTHLCRALLLHCFSFTVIIVHSCKAKPALMQNCLHNFVLESALWAVCRLPGAGSKYMSHIHCAQCENALWPLIKVFNKKHFNKDKNGWSFWYWEDSSLMSNALLRHWSPNRCLVSVIHFPHCCFRLQDPDAFIALKKLLLGQRFS